MSLEERLKYAQMKARHQDIFRPWYKKWWGITIIAASILVFLLLGLASAYVANQVQGMLAGGSAPTTQDYESFLKAIKGDGTNYYTGPADASITIIEFGDFACPFCRQSAPGLRRIAAEYEDRVKVIFRDYPLHENSIDLALGARCAGEQGHFWDYHDQVYLYKEETTASGAELRDMLMSLAAEMRLDTAKFDKCLTDRRYVAQIKKDYDDGELLQIAGTPTWFINNYMITGHMPEEQFRELINGLIQEQGSPAK